MILPDKHIKFSESIIGLGAYLMMLLDCPKSIDVIWGDISSKFNSKELPAYHSFDNFVLTLDFLFMINAIDVDGVGRVYKCD